MHASCNRSPASEETLARLPGVARVAVVPARGGTRRKHFVVLELASAPPLPSAVRAALGERRHTSRAFVSLNPLPQAASGEIDGRRLARLLREALRAPGGALAAGYLEL